MASASIRGVRERAPARVRAARLLLGIVGLMAGLAAAATETVVARVNGEPITDVMVREVVRGLIKDQGAPPSSEEIAKLNDEALQSLIDFELLYQDARARGITVSEAEIDAEIARTRSRFADQQQYEAALEQSGLSGDKLRLDTRKTLMVERLLRDVVWKDLRISPEQARAIYDKNSRAFVHDGKQIEFAEARPRIERLLREVEERKRQQEFVAKLRQAAKIERPTPTY